MPYLTLFASTLLLSLFTVGCDGTSNQPDYTLADFKISALDSSSVEYFLPEVFLGRPTQVKIINHNQLIVLDRKDASWLTLIDLSNGRQIDFLGNGRGPNESLAVRDLFVRGNDLIVTGTTDSKVIRFRIKGDSIEPISEDVLPGYHVRIAPHPKGGYICLPISNNRLQFITDNCTQIDNFGTFPQIVDKNEDKITNAVFQSMIDISPDGRHILSVFQTINFFQIYNESLNEITKNGPKSDNIIIKTKETPIGSMTGHVPRQSIFRYVTTSDMGFVVGYIGQVFESSEEPRQDIKELLSFDWEGNPCQRLLLPQQLVSFDIDWSTNTLYGITSDDSQSLVSISLPELF